MCFDQAGFIPHGTGNKESNRSLVRSHLHNTVPLSKVLGSLAQKCCWFTQLDKGTRNNLNVR